MLPLLCWNRASFVSSLLRQSNCWSCTAVDCDPILHHLAIYKTLLVGWKTALNEASWWIDTYSYQWLFYWPSSSCFTTVGGNELKSKSLTHSSYFWLTMGFSSPNLRWLGHACSNCLTDLWTPMFWTLIFKWTKPSLSAYLGYHISHAQLLWKFLLIAHRRSFAKICWCRMAMLPGCAGGKRSRRMAECISVTSGVLWCL